MTIEDLYNKISAREDLKNVSPLFDTYTNLYDAWSMNPSPHAPQLTGMSRLLSDLYRQFPELLDELLAGSKLQDLKLPGRVSPPELRELDRRILPPAGEGEPLYIKNTEEQVEEIKEPGLLTKAGNFVAAMADFASSGFKQVTPEQLAERKAICAGCKFFDPAGYGGTGKCRKCGCSSYKLDIAASRCPVGYWESIE
jgi:hypothetical protein